MTNIENGGLSGARAERSRAPRGSYKRYISGTYIGLVAYAIQDSPDKMLTFKQIMKKLEPFVLGNKKCVENNIRVCLSSNRCFVKVPVDPNYPNPKKNFWKVDENGITPKMFRRHFKYLINILPGLSIQTQQVKECGNKSYAPEPLIPACKVTENKSESKFTGPFSIESLLKSERDVKRLEEHPHYTDTQRGTNKRKHIYEYEAVRYYYPVSAVGCELAPVKRPRLSSGPQFGRFPPPHVTYDPRVLFSSPSMYDIRYFRW
ncbi:forkhead box protein H1-like [Carassius auratus]|uniref:Forkhead box protein H1-like n=1 Tax=Carassius auratus TaxID=7957 RepID=A0A6P6NW17_CARAU|nr:forkhead box protein H1-like [Carassius auratus]